MTNKIEVIGLGAGDLDQLPLGVYRRLKQAASGQKVYARTLDHPVISELQEEAVIFQAFDHIYEKNDDFAAVYEEIASVLLNAAKENSLIYVVPGHPMLAESTVQLLLAQTDVEIEIVGGHSYLDDLFTALRIDPIDGFQFVDATNFTREALSYQNHLVFCQVYDAFIASEVKLTLLEDLSPDTTVFITEAAGTRAEKLVKVPLVELDRVMEMSNLTSVYVPPVKENLPHQFTTLRQVIQTLRGPDGCPWDQKQTHESLRPYAIEEVYELIEAINAEDDEHIVEELGDVLLQVMLHSQIGEDDGYFTIDDVIKRLTEKMIHRHPHVFTDAETYPSWEELKAAEKDKAERHSILADITRHGPQLQVAYKLQKKAAKVGFDWDNVADVWQKLDEEIAEFKAALENESKEAQEMEFGDILFVLTNLAKHYQLQPELALMRANEKFMDRFQDVEKQVQAKGKQFSQFTFAALDQFWDNAKRKE